MRFTRKNQKIIAAVICVILVLSMVASLFAALGSF